MISVRMDTTNNNRKLMLIDETIIVNLDINFRQLFLVALQEIFQIFSNKTNN